MSNIEIVIVYIIGYILAYILVKRSITKEYKDDDWTIFDRKMCLMYALLSWVQVVIELLSMIPIFNDDDASKKASW